MYNIHYLNPISAKGTALWTEDYSKCDKMEEAEAVMVRSAAMHDLELPENLLAVARAGAGVNNIPLNKCAEQGVVVKATGTALTVELYGNGACDAGVSAGFNGKLYMFCDITDTGITDANAFWAACGEAVFYGTKEIEV